MLPSNGRTQKKLESEKFEILSTKIKKLASVYAGKPASILNFGFINNLTV